MLTTMLQNLPANFALTETGEWCTGRRSLPMKQPAQLKADFQSRVDWRPVKQQRTEAPASAQPQPAAKPIAEQQQPADAQPSSSSALSSGNSGRPRGRRNRRRVRSYGRGGHSMTESPSGAAAVSEAAPPELPRFRGLTHEEVVEKYYGDVLPDGMRTPISPAYGYGTGTSAADAASPPAAKQQSSGSPLYDRAGSRSPRPLDSPATPRHSPQRSERSLADSSAQRLQVRELSPDSSESAQELAACQHEPACLAPPAAEGSPPFHAVVWPPAPWPYRAAPPSWRYGLPSPAPRPIRPTHNPAALLEAGAAGQAAAPVHAAGMSPADWAVLEAPCARWRMAARSAAAAAALAGELPTDGKADEAEAMSAATEEADEGAEQGAAAAAQLYQAPDRSGQPPSLRNFTVEYEEQLVAYLQVGC